jgi:glycosyltransferase involved in cell wall biosynthesis
MKAKRAIFTICSNNYLASARTFFDSVRKYQPEVDLFLCLADRRLPTGEFYCPDWTVVEAATLTIPDFSGFSFRYDVMEFNTALKPFMFEYLLNKKHYDAVLYFDPDIEIFRSLDHIFSKLVAGASFFLTPHLCSPSELEIGTNDITIMKAGIYNLGFLGASRGDEASRVIAWWARRLRYQCINAQSEGIFVDQKFIDLVPGFAPNAHISCDTTLNVAYWNLPQRHLEMRDGHWFVDDHPLTFFHYSGFNPNLPTRLSKHDNRFDNAMDEPIRCLTKAYAEKLIQNGYGIVSSAIYAYGRFDSGTEIHPFIREMFRKNHQLWPSDPFSTFEPFLHEPWPGASRRRSGYIVTNFMKFLYDKFTYLHMRLDLNNPDHVVELVNWYILHAPEELDLDLPLVEPEAVKLGSLRCKPTPIAKGRFGSDVTVIGYLRTASGVGEVARQTVRALIAGGLQVEAYDTALGVASVRNDHSCDDFLVERGTAPVQIFNINADQLPIVIGATRAHLRQKAFKINIPFWELGRYPDAWLPAFDVVDEIWAPSRFIQRALVGRVNRPVIYMPTPIELEHYTPKSRKYFGLPERSYLFFFAFDFLSFIERKNPSAVVQAFRKAFPTYGKAALVLKCINGAMMPEKYHALQQEIDNNPDIILLDQTMSRTDVLALMATVDAIVSLHRSEGLGLLLAEAILLGKPVIATGYSASREIITRETGYPVGFQMVPVKDGEYPFHVGQKWADPDIGHAAWIMRYIYNEPKRAAAPVLKGQDFLRRQHSRHSVAKFQEKRLRILGVH